MLTMAEAKEKLYHSIENVQFARFVEKVRGLDSGLWVVTEKVHGANMSLATSDGQNVTVASRTQTLGAAGYKQFYNCGELAESLFPMVKKLWEEVSKMVENPSIRVFGELFGGGYPKMPGVPKITRVQKGVEYFNGLGFYAFDLRVNDKLLDYSIALPLLKKCGFFAAEALFVGEFEEALQWSRLHNADNSTIGKLLGMPDLEINIREGHVLKPDKHIVLPGGETVMLKDKNEKFAEAASKPKISSTEQKNSTDQFVTDVLPMINENRLIAVVSKIGDFASCYAEDKYFPNKVSKLLAADAIEDFCKDHVLVDVDLKRAEKMLRDSSMKIILAYMKSLN